MIMVYPGMYALWDNLGKYVIPINNQIMFFVEKINVQKKIKRSEILDGNYGYHHGNRGN